MWKKDMKGRTYRKEGNYLIMIFMELNDLPGFPEGRAYRVAVYDNTKEQKPLYGGPYNSEQKAKEAGLMRLDMMKAAA